MLAKLFRTDTAPPTRAQELRAELEQLGTFTSRFSELQLETGSARSRVEQLETNTPKQLDEVGFRWQEDLRAARVQLQACQEKAASYEREHSAQLERAEQCGRELQQATVIERAAQDTGVSQALGTSEAARAYAKACNALEEAAIEFGAQLLAADTREGNASGKYFAGMPRFLAFATPVNLQLPGSVGRRREIYERMKARAAKIVGSR